VLKPFHEDSAQLQTAVDHLVAIGFLRRRDVLRAGGVNMLWGLLLQVGEEDKPMMEEWFVYSAQEWGDLLRLLGIQLRDTRHFMHTNSLAFVLPAMHVRCPLGR
jgi:hypothetical protein